MEGDRPWPGDVLVHGESWTPMTETSGRPSPSKRGSVTDITPDSLLSEVMRHHPSTGLILLQQGRLFRVRPGNLYPAYSDPFTVREFAAMNGLALEPLLDWLRRGAEKDQTRVEAGREEPGYEVPERRTPPSGELGYTGDSQDPGPAEAEATLFTATLAQRGPD